MERLGQACVRLLLLLAGFVAVAKILAGLVGGIMGAGSVVQGVVGLLLVPGALVLGTRALCRWPAVRPRVRSFAVILGATSCGVGLVTLCWPFAVASLSGTAVTQVEPPPAWLGDGVALAMCGCGGLFAVLVASAVLSDDPVP